MTITLKEHGIYRRRDGRIVGPIARYAPHPPERPFEVEGLAYFSDGTWFAKGEKNDADLIEEIVVGEGWIAWNGGNQPVAGDVVVDVVPLFPGSAWLRDRAKYWSWDTKTNPILAYRVVEEAKAATASPNMDWLFVLLRDRIRELEAQLSSHRTLLCVRSEHAGRYLDRARVAEARVADIERQNADLQAANNRLLERARAAEAATAEALSRLSNANGVLGKLRDAVSDLLGAQET
jgi:hypothetical protein